MGRPTKIMVITCGTRGDIQPFIAIGCALQRAGYTIMMGSNEDHESFVKEFGLQFWPISLDCDKILKEMPSAVKAMADGNVFEFLGATAEIGAKDAPMATERIFEMVQDFKPDLLVEGTFGEYFGRVFALLCDIPRISVKLQYLGFDPKRMVLGLPTLPCGCHKFLLHKIIGGIHDTYKIYDEAMSKQRGCKILDLWTKSDYLQEFRDPWAPVHICQSPSWKDVLNPCAPANVKFVGSCIIKAAAQAGESFGGEEAMKSIKSFLAAGRKPVYCGWGSMTCKSQDHMVVFAARAIMNSGQRGIILSGSAKLNMSVLSKATEDAALLAYAEKNILFVGRAPHEWLFPQVSCTVHHGGAGTTAAAMRAGMPTIITPVWLDQWDHAYMVNKLGVGIGFAKQFQKISAEELGDAIKEAIESTEIAAKAKQMGEILLEEDGAQNIVNAVQDFWQQWVESGRYRAKIAEIKRAHKEASQSFWAQSFDCFRGCFSCFAAQESREPDAKPFKENTGILMPVLLSKNPSHAMDEFDHAKILRANKYFGTSLMESGGAQHAPHFGASLLGKL